MFRLKKIKARYIYRGPADRFFLRGQPYDIIVVRGLTGRITVTCKFGQFAAPPRSTKIRYPSEAEFAYEWDSIKV